MPEESSFKLAVAPNPRVRFDILHEDGDLLVIGKPAGLVTQPGKGHTTDSLLNGLFARWGKRLHNLGVGRDYGLLHRLDKGASGILVVALGAKAYDILREDFEARKIDKEYAAIVGGAVQPAQGVIQARLKETIVDGVKKSIVTRGGQEAITAYKVRSQSTTAALLSVTIKTGRLHQIRVHMMFQGNPILGDSVYGPDAARALPLPPRLCLHAYRLGFKHPIDGQWREFTAPIPPDLLAYAARLKLTNAAAET